MGPKEEQSFSRIVERLAPGATLTRSWPLTGGVSASVTGIEWTGPDGATSRAVVRRPGATDWKPAGPDGAAREFALLRALSAAGVEVPAALLFDDSLEILPSPYLVMELVEGRTGLDDAERPAALEQMAGFLAHLHALPVPALEPPGLPAREDPALGALEYLPDTPRHADVRAALAEHTGRASRNAPGLVHGDYWPGNVLWRDGRLAAVIDWEDAALGDPLSDLAQCRVELLWGHGDEAMEAFTAHYRHATSLDEHDLPVWELFVAASGAAFMGEWGLAPEREADMRAKAERVVARASRDLVAQR